MLSFRKLTIASVVAAGFAFGAACSDGESAGAEGSGANGSGADGSGANGSGGDGSGNTSSGGSDGTSGGADGAAGTGAGPTVVDGKAFCGDTACACSDGIDNDGDGQIDGFDIECQGPLDNDEGSFATGIPGDNKDEAWVDCFFDGDSGSGNDGCKYPHGCLTGEIDVDDERCAGAVSDACIDYCGARTPNGCDCFGCCTIKLENGETLDILTSGSCSLEEIDNEEVCIRCNKTDTCQNTCGECELCPGKGVEDLPESCEPDPPAGGAPGDPPPVYECEGGFEVCSGSLPCKSGYYCSFGCCLPVVK